MATSLTSAVSHGVMAVFNCIFYGAVYVSILNGTTCQAGPGVKRRLAGGIEHKASKVSPPLLGDEPGTKRRAGDIKTNENAFLLLGIIVRRVV